MEHRQAVDVIYQLIPKMEKDSPEKVLTKYATDESLAPQQLAKVARLFNTCSTLHTMESDRNKSPRLVDVSSLIEKYANRYEESEKSTTDSFLAEIANLEQAETLQVPIKSASATSDEQPYAGSEVPNLYNPKPAYEPVVVPVEESPFDRDARISRWNRAFSERIKLAHQLFEKTAFCLQEYAEAGRELAKKAAKYERNHEVPALGTLEYDAQGYLNPGQIKLVGDLVEKAARTDRLHVSRELPKQSRNYILRRDSTGMMEDFQGVWEKFKEAAVAKASTHQLLEEMQTHLTSDQEAQGNQKAARMIEQFAKNISCYEVVSFDLTKQANPAPDLKAENDFLRQKVQEEQELNQKIQEENEKHKKMMQGIVRTKGRQEQDLKERTTNSPDNVTLEKFKDDTVDAFKGPAQTFNKFQDQLSSALKSESDRYKKRKQEEELDLEKTEQDTRSMAVLQRLMATDEIIAEQDPNLVVEAFNTIRKASPEVASDPSLLRLVLRNSLQHQGVDIDTATAARKFEGEKSKKNNKS